MYIETEILRILPIEQASLQVPFEPSAIGCVNLRLTKGVTTLTGVKARDIKSLDQKLPNYDQEEVLNTNS
jgi:hypothetical protein